MSSRHKTIISSISISGLENFVIIKMLDITKTCVHAGEVAGNTRRLKNTGIFPNQVALQRNGKP